MYDALLKSRYSSFEKIMPVVANLVKMGTKKVFIYWSAYFGAVIICQLLFGSFPTDFFAFPVNGALLLFAIAGLWILYKEKRNSWLCALLLDRHTTFILLSLLLVSCLVMGFGGDVLAASSWWFVLLMTALLCHLLMVIFRGVGMKNRRYKWRFALNHIGLFIALVGGFVGSADTQEWRMVVGKADVTSVAVDASGRHIVLPYELRLKDFNIDYYPGGMPAAFVAGLEINGKNVSLEVNHPYSLSVVDNLYLLDYEHRPAGESPQYCILQLVREPWKYAQWAGIWMMLAGCVLLFAQGVNARKEVQA